MLTEPMFAQVIELLEQGKVFLSSIDDETYLDKSKRQGLHSSISEHYRHCLEYAINLTNALELGVSTVDYDNRRVASDITKNKQSTIKVIADLQNRLERLPSFPSSHVLIIQELSSYSSNADQSLAKSSLTREIKFFISHTIHHFALIRFICDVFFADRDIRFPKNFGISPSTVRLNNEARPALKAYEIEVDKSHNFSLA